MQKESVVIIIAAYNARKTVARSVRSALAQDDATEVIVVDDASSDDTARQAQQADDGTGRLKILTQPQNRGPSAARNRAIRESAAPWISILDADDFMLPGRIRRLLALSEQADLMADDLWQVHENNADGPYRSMLEQESSAPKLVSFREFVLGNVTREGRSHRELGFIKPVMRRSFLQERNVLYKEHMKLGEDYELYARLLAQGGRLLLVPALGYISVIRDNSLSRRHTETDLLHLRDCNRQLQAIPTLSEEDRRALQQNYLSVDCRLQWRLMIKAVKEKNLLAAFGAFLRPWPVPLYVARQLIQQLGIRLRRSQVS